MGFIAKKDKRWPNGIIPYKFSTCENATKVSNEHQELVRACMRTWESCINLAAHERGSSVTIRFQEIVNDVDFYYLIENTNIGSTSAGSVGLMSAEKGKRILFSIRFGRDIASIPHELAHCIGVAHENERNAPSRFLTLPKDPPRLCYYTEDQNARKDLFSDWNRYERLSKKYVEVGGYDTKSITHYPRGSGRRWNVDKYNIDVTLPNGLVLRNNERELLNRPSEQQVKDQTWRPSAGDIDAIIALYED